MKFEYHTEIECDKDQKHSGNYYGNTLAGQHQTKLTEGLVWYCVALSGGGCAQPRSLQAMELQRS